MECAVYIIQHIYIPVTVTPKTQSFELTTGSDSIQDSESAATTPAN